MQGEQAGEHNRADCPVFSSHQVRRLPAQQPFPKRPYVKAHAGAYVHKAPTPVMESMNSFTGSEALTLLSRGSNRLSLSTLAIMLPAAESVCGEVKELQFRVRSVTDHRLIQRTRRGTCFTGKRGSWRGL